MPDRGGEVMAFFGVSVDPWLLISLLAFTLMVAEAAYSDERESRALRKGYDLAARQCHEAHGDDR